MKRIVLPAYPLRALHLVALWAYAVSQPIFALLEANPEFLVVRGSSRSEVVVFALLLALGAPLLATASELAVRRLASTRIADRLHLVYIGIFVAPLALQLLKHVDASREAAILGVAAVAVLALAAYSRFEAARLFLTVSLVLPVVGLVSFVWGVPLATADDVPSVNVQIDRRTPVVMLVLDELPVSSLLGSDGNIDEQRFPSFARLAADGTWYAAATTVHEHTTHAVPAMLDGRLPRADELPRLADHPQNLFTLLGESYDLRVWETFTRLCPSRYCAHEGGHSMARRLQSLFKDVRVAYLHRVLPKSLAHGLPSIDDRWSGFGDDVLDADVRDLVPRPGDAERIELIASVSTGTPRLDFASFLSSLRRRESDRTLHFLHLMLPHSPWHFLPSGRTYGNAWSIDGVVRDDVDGGTWRRDPWLVQQGYQRHLLQVAYTDRLLGRLLDRLTTTGLYERSLVVVVADHGVSFVRGGDRRKVNRANIADIARVPLIIKFPGQKDGAIDARPVRTIDLLPTIADVLGVRLSWRTDGRSLLEPGPTPTQVVVMQRDGTRVSAAVGDVERAMRATVRRNLARLGEGDDSFYEIGSNRHLLRRSVTSIRTRRSSASRVHFDDEGLFSAVDLSSSFVPARITGFIEGVEIPDDAELAVAVNGRIAALTRCFSLDGRQRFSALAPETSFIEGFNRVELLMIEGPSSAPRLLKLGENAQS